MTTEKKTAPKAAQVVHTSAQTKPEKPAEHKPSAPLAVDEFHGKAGCFVRDPVTGERKPDPATEVQAPAAEPSAE